MGDTSVDSLLLRMQMLSRIVEHLPVVVYVRAAGPDAVPRYLNDQLSTLLRLQGPDARAGYALWREHLHPDDHDAVLARVRASEADGTPFFTEYRMCAADGATLWVSDHARMLQAVDTGERVRVGVIKDITERKQLDLSLRRSVELNDAILASLPDMVAYLDADLRIQRASASFGRAYGLSPAQLDGELLEEILGSDSLEAVRALLRSALAGQAKREELWLHQPAHGRRCIDLHLVPHRDETDEVRGVVLIGRDLTAATRSRDALRQSEARFRAMARNLPGAIFRYLEHPDGSSQALYISDGCRELWEVDAHIVQHDASVLWDMVQPADRRALRASVRRSARELSDWEHEWRITTPSGVHKWLMGKGKPQQAGNGSVVWDSVITDVTVRKNAEQTLDRMAHEDHLTGLPNRPAFHARLEEVLGRRRERDLVALLFIDLDNFKQVNDSFGHNAGDRLLVDLSALLAGVVPAGFTLARLSGDEFAVLIERARDQRDASALAEAMLAAVARWRFVAEQQEIAVTMSIGISLAPLDARDAVTMLRTADTAMYRAKAHGRNRYQFYDQSFTEEVQRRIALENGLRQALEGDGLVLEYQPQVTLADGALVGVEALLRWRHPRRGILLPVEFLAIAEGSGIIGPIGEWVLRAAFAAFSVWKRAGIAPPRLALNVSARQVADRDFPRQVETMLRRFDLTPAEVELELSEDLLVVEGGDSQKVLEALAGLGVSMAIDDFGTGRSSLAYLRRLPLDRVKIDPSFVADLPDGDAAAIVRGIVSLADSLGLGVIAEGVELPGQAEFLLASGCPEAQGYLLAAPTDAETLRPLLAAGRVDPGLGPG